MVIWRSNGQLCSKVHGSRKHKLPKQTWVHTLTCSKANLRTPGCDEGKRHSINYRTPNKNSRTLNAQKSLSRKGLSKPLLKASKGRGIPEHVISCAQFSDWLMVR